MQGAPSLPPSGLRKRGASSIFKWRAQGPDPEHLSPQNPQKSHSSPSCSWAIRAAGPRTCSDTALSYGARPGHSTGSGSVLFGRLSPFWKAQSILEGSFLRCLASRRILARERRMGTAMGRKSGM